MTKSEVDVVDVLDQVAKVFLGVVVILALYGAAALFAVMAKGYRLQRPVICSVCECPQTPFDGKERGSE